MNRVMRESSLASRRGVVKPRLPQEKGLWKARTMNCEGKQEEKPAEKYFYARDAVFALDSGRLQGYKSHTQWKQGPFRILLFFHPDAATGGIRGVAWGPPFFYMQGIAWAKD